jgi:hypothetical protein
LLGKLASKYAPINHPWWPAYKQLSRQPPCQVGHLFASADLVHHGGMMRGFYLQLPQTIDLIDLSIISTVVLLLIISTVESVISTVVLLLIISTVELLRSIESTILTIV